MLKQTRSQLTEVANRIKSASGSLSRVLYIAVAALAVACIALVVATRAFRMNARVLSLKVA